MIYTSLPLLYHLKDPVVLEIYYIIFFNVDITNVSQSCSQINSNNFINNPIDTSLVTYTTGCGICPSTIYNIDI
jgi:hypothetical protein